MCIVLITTDHPDYALIVLDNRDEFIMRPTSRPHWWKSGSQNILAARDLQRKEQGTWMGVTESGKFAVLTNYRENTEIEGTRSRGAIVTACLTGPEDESTEEFVERLVASDVKGVGGFSLVCGTLRKSGRGVKPLAIVSNRSSSVEEIAWIARERGDIWGLSNARYGDAEWPKVVKGKELLKRVTKESRWRAMKEDELLGKCWEVLDDDTLLPKGNQSFVEFVGHLKESIFIHALGGNTRKEDGDKLEADEIAAAGSATEHEPGSNGSQRHSPVSEAVGMAEEMYGTQRQTIMLVDWSGKCSYIERALYDEQGNAVPRGHGDIRFEFQIKGFDGVR